MTQKLLLVVDDYDDNRVILRAVLEHAGFSVLLACNGAEAVEQARRHRPHLVLMDLMMPVMDGWEAARILKADEDTAATPIVAVSASDRPDATEELTRAGFCAFIGKPVAPRQLLQAVAQCLEHAESGTPGWIELAGAGF